jgi:hypothetical protein
MAIYINIYSTPIVLNLPEPITEPHNLSELTQYLDRDLYARHGFHKNAREAANK